ncbi:HD-GYP domain-containing protein [Bacillus sp. V59.32b]|uniref:HD-GYP domain-containing protein n=1 Tax=Bacillus sp. V59.32b TaxID=1758642 RepID=UPI0020B14D2C|nr:HD-GYP domain-containing protein [Bacillus sp. V59.32b]
MKPMELMTAPNEQQKIKKVLILNTEITLQSSVNGVEVIHFKLGKGDIFSNSPDWATNPDFLRSITSLKGSLEIHIGHEKMTINGGDTTTNIPSFSPIRFKAITNCEFLIVTSEPIFEEIYVAKGMKIHQLAADIEEKDGYTLNHCSRIQRLSDLVGDKLGLPSDELITLTYGAFLHDIGKVKIPLKILQKPGKLTSAEWKVMKKHPLYGAELLRETGFDYLTKASLIVEQHHERWDGKGYPYGLKGEEISLGASIVSVVDAYDAMVSNRVYCPSLSKEEALEEIVRNRGTMYRPEIVDAFVAVYDQLEIISPLTKYKKIN